MLTSYPAFGKIPRLHKPVIITEKIDGTNGLVAVQPLDSDRAGLPHTPLGVADGYGVWAGSRNRWLAIGGDNFGFASWVTDHVPELVALGIGHHYGEWWGHGIQRGYGYTKGTKRFSLFNVTRWGNPDDRPACCDVVPVVARGDGRHLNDLITEALLDLSAFGSQAAPGYERPEGVVVYHTASGSLYKVTLDGDTSKALMASPLRTGETSMGAPTPANMIKPVGLDQFLTSVAA